MKSFRDPSTRLCGARRIRVQHQHPRHHRTGAMILRVEPPHELAEQLLAPTGVLRESIRIPVARKLLNERGADWLRLADPLQHARRCLRKRREARTEPNWKASVQRMIPVCGRLHGRRARRRHDRHVARRAGSPEGAGEPLQIVAIT